MENKIRIQLDPKNIETSISLLNHLYDSENNILLQIYDRDKLIPLYHPEEPYPDYIDISTSESYVILRSGSSTSIQITTSSNIILISLLRGKGNEILISANEKPAIALITKETDIGKVNTSVAAVIAFSEINNIGHFENFSELTVLELRECKDLTNMYPIANLNQLKSLKLYECQSLENLNFLSNLTNLFELVLDDCGRITNFKDISNLNELNKLEIYGNDQG